MLPSVITSTTVQDVLLRCEMPGENDHVRRVLSRVKTCRTAALGYHVYRCSNNECGFTKYQYHSCRDRHCPNCGALKKQEWIEARTRELLPVKYYHVVFTLPHELNSLIMGNRTALFKLLFEASSQTLLSFANDRRYLGATPGIISVLHTWGQQLSFHPHVHCIVSGGGITKQHQWKEAHKSVYRFLFPVKAMQQVFRGKFVAGLKLLIAKKKIVLQEGVDIAQLLNLLYAKDWVVYAKAPFAGPHGVIEYLGRYTHKVAIGNHRICSIDQDDDTVTFDYKDYRVTSGSNSNKQMTLSCGEFVRRFAQHILPRRFTKIRSYGYLANRDRRQRINEVLETMNLPVHKERINLPWQTNLLVNFGVDVHQCPCCQLRTMQLMHIVLAYKRGADG